MVSMQANPAQWVMPNLPGGGDGHYTSCQRCVPPVDRSSTAAFG